MDEHLFFFLFLLRNELLLAFYDIFLPSSEFYDENLVLTLLK